VPVVLIIAGFGPTNREDDSALLPQGNDSLKLLAEALADAGFASVLTGAVVDFCAELFRRRKRTKGRAWAGPSYCREPDIDWPF
jgi:hypothetical protein